MFSLGHADKGCRCLVAAIVDDVQQLSRELWQMADAAADGRAANAQGMLRMRADHVAATIVPLLRGRALQYQLHAEPHAELL